MLSGGAPPKRAASKDKPRLMTTSQSAPGARRLDDASHHLRGRAHAAIYILMRDSGTSALRSPPLRAVSRRVLFLLPGKSR